MADYFFYKGQMYRTDELKHWKYVKREKKNGKWVYYYDDSELKEAKAKEKRAMTYQLRSVADVVGAKDADSRKANGAVGYVSANTQQKRYMMKYNEKQHDVAVKNLNRVTIKHLAVAPIAKGAAYIANLFSGIGKKKKKGSRIKVKVTTSGPYGK